MSVTESYRKQHDEFLAIIRELRPQLDPTQLASNARQVRASLLTLFGKFSVHLAVEDEALYPRCQKHTDPKLRTLANAFAEEMSGTKAAVASFVQKWTDVRMRSHPGDFCTETKALFVALEERIRRENTELYVLLDRLG